MKVGQVEPGKSGLRSPPTRSQHFVEGVPAPMIGPRCRKAADFVGVSLGSLTVVGFFDGPDDQARNGVNLRGPFTPDKSQEALAFL